MFGRSAKANGTDTMESKKLSILRVVGMIYEGLLYFYFPDIGNAWPADRS